jgi:hypothetical protein
MNPPRARQPRPTAGLADGDSHLAALTIARGAPDYHLINLYFVRTLLRNDVSVVLRACS